MQKYKNQFILPKKLHLLIELTTNLLRIDSFK